MIRLVESESGKIQDLIIIYALNNHNIDLNGLKLQLSCQSDTFPDLLKTVIACYLLVLFPVKSV